MLVESYQYVTNLAVQCSDNMAGTKCSIWVISALCAEKASTVSLGTILVSFAPGPSILIFLHMISSMPAEDVNIPLYLKSGLSYVQGHPEWSPLTSWFCCKLALWCSLATVGLGISSFHFCNSQLLNLYWTWMWNWVLYWRLGPGPWKFPLASQHHNLLHNHKTCMEFSLLTPLLSVTHILKSPK